MKNYTQKSIVVILLLFIVNIYSQAPQKMSYQASLRNASGVLLTTIPVGMIVSVLSGSATGSAVYVETHTTTTNQNGLVSIQIGGGNPSNGTFSGINWGSNTYFIKTETDPNGGTNYTIVNTTQMMSVPYALYAENSKNLGRTTIVLSGDITDAQAAVRIASEAGPNTENISIYNTTALTTVNFSAITSLMQIAVYNNPILNTIALPNLSIIYAQVQIINNPLLSSVTFPALTTINGPFKLQGNALTNLTFPQLMKSFENTNNIEINEVNLTSLSFPSLIIADKLKVGSPNLTSFAAPLLTKSKDFRILNSKLNSISLPSFTGDANGIVIIDSNSLLTTLNMPVWAAIQNIDFTSNPLFTTINLPSLTTCIQLKIEFNSTLTTITAPTLNSCTNVLFRQNKLPSSMVNTWLNKMLTVTPATGKTIYLNQQSPLAPPTGAGITDKAALISAGNTVQTD